MLKQILVKMAKTAVLAGFVVTTVVMSGCGYAIRIEMGTWKTNPDGSKTCVEGSPAQCPLPKITAS